MRELVIILISSFISQTILAAPASLKCTENVEIQFQSNWVRSSYIGLKTNLVPDYIEWFSWSGKEPRITATELNTRNQRIQGIPEKTEFIQFVILPEQHWWGTGPLPETSYLFIESSLFDGANSGTVVVRTEIEETGVLIRKHETHVSQSILSCRVE